MPTNFFLSWNYYTVLQDRFHWDHCFSLKKISLIKHLCKQEMKPPVRNHLAGHYWKQMVSKRSWTHLCVSKGFFAAVSFRNQQGSPQTLPSWVATMSFHLLFLHIHVQYLCKTNLNIIR